MPTATLEALEQRITAIERKFASLEQHNQANKPQVAASHGTLGLFADEPEMVDEMMALIRAERDKSIQNFERVAPLGYPLLLDNWKSP